MPLSSTIEPSPAPPAPLDPLVLPPQPPITSTPHVSLRYDLKVDLAVSAGLTATLITYAAVVQPAVRVPACTICDPAGGRVNAVDDFFRSALRMEGSAARSISDIVAYVGVPASGVVLAVVAAAADKRVGEAPLNILLVAEAGLAFAVIQQAITLLLPRERPDVHAAQGEEREALLLKSSSMQSFPGGHNGLAFAVAAAGGTIATMRGYRLAPLVWIAGGVIAITTSYLRIAADRHYFTDVVTGAVLGTGIGIAVPLLFHRPVKGEQRPAALRWLDNATFSTSEVPGGRIVRVGWGF